MEEDRMVSLTECGTQVDLKDIEERFTSVGVQVTIDRPDNCAFDKEIPRSPTNPLLGADGGISSTQVVIEETHEYTPDYCCDLGSSCLLCDRRQRWYSLNGKGCLWVLLLTPWYLVLGIVIFPFFLLMGIAYCVAAAIE